MWRSGDKHKGGLNIRPIRRFAVGVLIKGDLVMIIKIDFYQKIDRSEVREAILSAFDLLGDNEKGGIFRDDYEYTNDEASYGNCLQR